MKYYKVMPKGDQAPRKDGGIHIRDELYTEKEIEKFGVNKSLCTPVEISKKKTHFFLGARFQD